MHWVCFVDLRYLGCADFSEFKGGVPAVYSWDCLKKTLFALLVQSNWHVLRTISSLIKSLAYYPLLKCSKDRTVTFELKRSNSKWLKSYLVIFDTISKYSF